MLAKTILNVPYAEKDQVKKLGAKWDPKQKLWYVPAGLDTSQFKPWFVQNSSKSTLLISNIGLIRNIVSCWSCKGICTINALYVRKIEQKNGDVENGFFILSNIVQVPDTLLDFLIIRCPNYRLGKANSLGIKQYRNHCDHCAIGLSDDRLHKKNGGLNPKTETDIRAMQFIDLVFFDELEVQADYVDYSNNIIYTKSAEFSDYLTDFI